MVFAFKRMIDFGEKHKGNRTPIIKSRHFESDGAFMARRCASR